MTKELQTLLPHVQAIAQAAGREISRIYATAFAVEIKADNSPLLSLIHISEPTRPY